MQDFLQGNFEDTNDSIERFETMNSINRELYFDVHQIENLFDYYLENNQLDLAEQILSIGLKQHPDAIPLQIKLSIILSEQGLYDESIEILENQRRLDPLSPELSMSLGWLYLKKGDEESALEYFNSTIDNADGEYESFILDIGFNLNQEGYYDLSIPYLLMGSAGFPENENIWFELAFAYDKTEQIEKGIEAYNNLLDLNPFFDNAWYNLGILYNRFGDFKKGVEAYEYSIAIDPEHSESYFNMGNSYAHLDQFDLALECYITYASFGHNNIVTFQYIGECWEQMGNTQMAIQFYRLVLELNEKSPEAWYGIGTSYMAEDKFTDSIYAFNKALHFNPGNPDYLFAHGKACRENKDFQTAIKSIEKGLLSDPEELWAWIELVQIHIEIDPTFNFIDFIDKALERYPTVGAVSYIAAVIYYKFAHDKDLALGYLKVGKRRQPDDLQVVLTEFPELLNAPEITKFINKKAKKVK